MTTSQSKIYTKLQREPFIVSQAQARSIEKTWKDSYDPDSTKITVNGNVSFTKEDIKGVMVLSDIVDRTVAQQEHFHDSFREEIQNRENMHRNPNHYKNTEFFLTLSAIMSQKPNFDTLQSAIEIQRNFFIKNQKRCYCDPGEFKAILPKEASVNVAQGAGMRVIEQIIRRDVQLSN